jgi:hypothetical protein
MGWKIDIKSEEEKRQEVETAMNALSAGAPLSVLIDYGMSDKLAEALIEAGIGTVERLGGMTPEELVEIPGVGPESVEDIRVAVNGYYAQFEEGVEMSEEGYEPRPDGYDEPSDSEVTQGGEPEEHLGEGDGNNYEQVPEPPQDQTFDQPVAPSTYRDERLATAEDLEAPAGPDESAVLEELDALNYRDVTGNEASLLFDTEGTEESFEPSVINEESFEPSVDNSDTIESSVIPANSDEEGEPRP